MRSTMGAELVRAKDCKRPLKDVRQRESRIVEEGASIEHGVGKFHFKRYRCTALQVVVANFMARVSSESLAPDQRAFFMKAQLHLGKLSTPSRLAACPRCHEWQIRFNNYMDWWREHKQLERWERATKIEALAIRKKQIEGIANVIRGRRDLQLLIENGQYDPLTGKLQY